MLPSPVTMVGPLPDISMIERFTPICEMIRFPVADEPVKPMASTPSWVTSCSPICASPGMIDTSPFGTPAASNAWASLSSAHEVWTGGLTMTALPVASPGPMYSSGMVTGKFHGVIAAHTPTGRRNVNMRTLRSVVGMTLPKSRLTSSADSVKYALASSMSPSDSSW